jgi:hypothetical protein
MTNHVIEFETARTANVRVNSAGLALGLLLGGLHLLWVLLVATGGAQPLIDFIFWLHFIRPVYVIEAFDPFRAAGLVLLTAAVGYSIGGTFALLWNRVHRSKADRNDVGSRT